MVTAILIPIIVFYFYYISKKERKKYEEKWLDLIHVKEESIITGRVINKTEERQRFYYHKFIFVTELQIQTSSKIINARRIYPITENFTPPDIVIGDEITCIGQWENKHLNFIKYNINRNKEK